MLSWPFGLGLPGAHAAMLTMCASGGFSEGQLHVHSPANSPQKIAFGHNNYGVVELRSDTALEAHSVKQEAVGAAMSQCCGGGSPLSWSFLFSLAGDYAPFGAE